MSRDLFLRAEWLRAREEVARCKRRHHGQAKAQQELQDITTRILKEYVWGRARKRRAA